MKILSRLIVTFTCAGLIGGVAMINPGKAYASGKHDYQRNYSQGGGSYRGHGYRGRGAHQAPRVIHRGSPIVVPDRRVRRYHNTYISRPYGRWYPGYGHYYGDNDAFAWLAFTAITLRVLDNLNENQQRAHEAAQIRATTAPVGETVIWNQGGASGSVTATRDGTSTSGRYCREFQQEVTVGNKREQAYGVACRQPDGSWEIVSTGAP
ncbi:MAG: RT0821/Lpp0805 family surface protein [Arenicellales bacterium]